MALLEVLLLAPLLVMVLVQAQVLPVVLLLEARPVVPLMGRLLIMLLVVILAQVMIQVIRLVMARLLKRPLLVVCPPPRPAMRIALPGLRYKMNHT